MRVTIKTVRKTYNEVHIIFSTAIGTGAAIWKAAPPETGEEQEVELEINDEFVYGQMPKAHVSFIPCPWKKTGSTSMLNWYRLRKME